MSEGNNNNQSSNRSIITLNELQTALTKIGIDELSQKLAHEIIPISATIIQAQTGAQTTCDLYKCNDTYIPPSTSYADFTITFNDPKNPKATQLANVIDQDLYNDLSAHNRSFNDSWIRINPDSSVDMRMTGSTTLLGLITLPGTGKNATTGSPVFINAAGELGTGSMSTNTTFTSDIFIAQGSTVWASKINPRSPTTTTSFSGNVFIMNGKDLTVTGSIKLNSVKNKTSSSSAVIVIDPVTGQLGTNTIQNPTYTFSSDAFIAKASTFWTGKISPRSSTTTTTFGGSISLPSPTTSNNGSLQINGTPFLHNFGTNNTFAGASAGNLKMSGSGNTALGSGSLVANTSASNNTAVGYGSLNANTTGAGNIAIGQGAGNALTTGSNNIDIGNAGVAAEASTIRIGTAGTHTSCFVAGITGVTIVGNAVSVNGSGQLGVVISSRRYKDDIKDMDTASNDLMKLRPVTFTYKSLPEQPMQYGLIAEEVAEIYPNLVCYKDGLPESVRYDVLPAMLLNEYQKLRKDYDSINERLNKLEQCQNAHLPKA